MVANEHIGKPRSRLVKGQRRTRGVVDWQPAFLTALEELGVITRACSAVGVTPKTVWLHRKQDPVFLAQFEDSLEAGALQLEAEAIRRARDGVRRMKFNSKTGLPFIDPETDKPYIEHEYSDTLMLALLKSHFPKYRDKPGEVHVSTTVNNVMPIARQRELQERRQAALAGRVSEA